MNEYIACRCGLVYFASEKEAAEALDSSSGINVNGETLTIVRCLDRQWGYPHDRPIHALRISSCCLFAQCRRRLIFRGPEPEITKSSKQLSLELQPWEEKKNLEFISENIRKLAFCSHLPFLFSEWVSSCPGHIGASVNFGVSSKIRNGAIWKTKSLGGSGRRNFRLLSISVGLFLIDFSWKLIFVSWGDGREHLVLWKADQFATWGRECRYFTVSFFS